MDILSTVHFYTCSRQNYLQFRDLSKSDLECQWHMPRCLEFDDFVHNSNARDIRLGKLGVYIRNHD
jgi:hypothetical protein